MTIPKQSIRRNELVVAAAKLFKENSFDRTTVRMLAAATGIKSGSLFHHFKGKEEILVAVIEDGLKKSLKAVQTETQSLTDINQKLFALIYAHLKTLHGSERDAHIVSITEWRSLSNESKQHLITLRDEYEQFWQKIIIEALDNGLLTGDPTLIRLFILGSLNWSTQWFQPSQGKSIKELAQEFYSMVVK
ncbi:MAG: TetR/AcrR family transcriptional regulator [Cycloclasticus sp.]|nr:TetR/AcrR family transcriptional regulator [Cycloclasticus sp.]